MQLPKYRKKKRIKLKSCSEPGCGKEFWGHPIAKYCEEHREPKRRTKPKKEDLLVDSKNMIFKHVQMNPTNLKFRCCLEGCDNIFNVTIHPKQYIYPRFCYEHRNDYRRFYFLQNIKSKQAVVELR